MKRVSCIRAIKTAISAVAIGLAGCVAASATRLGTKIYARTSPSAVVVFRAESEIPVPFERIGVINIGADWKYTKVDDLIEHAKREAAKLGANAILLGEVIEPSRSAKTADLILSEIILPSRVLRRSEVIALRVKALEEAAPRDALANASEERLSTATHDLAAAQP